MLPSPEAIKIFSFTILWKSYSFTFYIKSVINLELILGYSVKKVSYFIFIHVENQLSLCPLLKNVFFSHCYTVPTILLNALFLEKHINT